MILHVTEVRCLGQYRLFVGFDNGEAGEVDLRDALDGEVFEPLRDLNLFASARCDNLFRTVVWDNGTDMAPEYLLDRLHAQNRGAA